MAAVKLIIAFCTALGNDEVYYWTYALDLQWNYFDHPPIVAWLIRATTINLSLHHEVAVRFGAILSSSICTLIVYRIGQFLYNERVAWYAVLLYASSFYCSIIAGTFILPDSPQMVFWLWGIFLLLKISRLSDHQKPTLRLWLWFGLVSGLCMMSKVHGVFLWTAAGLIAVFGTQKFLRQPGLYLAALICLFILSPVIIWNIRHHFITYTYHSERVSLLHAGLNPIAFFRELSGEIFYNNPVVFLLVWLAVFSFPYTIYRSIKTEVRVLQYCAFPLILTLILLSLFRDTLPHWSGPAYSCLIFLAALKLDSFSFRKARLFVASALLVFLFIVVTGLSAIHFYPGTLSTDQETLSLGKGDPTLDLYGWKETGKMIDSLYRTELSKGNSGPVRTILVTKWFPAAHLDFYVCPGTALQTYGIGQVFDLHQYHLSNQHKQKPGPGESAYYITTSNLYDQGSIDFVKSKFRSCSVPVIIPIVRNGRVCKNVLLYRLDGYKN